MENDDKQKKTVNIPQYYVMELKESKVHVLENEPKFCFSISAYCFGNWNEGDIINARVYRKRRFQENVLTTPFS